MNIFNEHSLLLHTVVVNTLIAILSAVGGARRETKRKHKQEYWSLYGLQY